MFAPSLVLVFACALWHGCAAAPAKITAEQLRVALRRQPEAMFRHHFGFMFTLAGFGDKLYDVEPDLSADCAATARAALRMLEQLRICEEVYQAVMSSMTAVEEDLRSGGAEHPLELFCRKVGDTFGREPHLSATFEATKRAVKDAPPTTRPAYSDTLIDSLEKLGKLLNKHLVVPQLAKSMAIESFRDQGNKTKAYTTRYHLLAKSVFAMAQKDQFNEPLQSLYEKTLEEILPEITKQEPGRSLVLDDYRTLWFCPQMMRKIYGHIAENPHLLRELNHTAATLGQGYHKTELDFSKI